MINLLLVLLIIVVVALAVLVVWTHFKTPTQTPAQLLQSAVHTLLDVFHPVIDFGLRCLDWLRPRLMHRPLLAMLAADAGALIAHAVTSPLAALAMLAANLVTPLAPADAPKTLAPPRPNPRKAVPA